MIYGVGTDIIEIDRIRRAVESRPRFLQRIFTAKEREYFAWRRMKWETIAGGFAAKEAISKALGTGFGKLGFQDVEVLRDERGKPLVSFAERVQLPPSSLCMVSISHCREYAVATAILYRQEQEEKKEGDLK